MGNEKSKETHHSSFHFYPIPSKIIKKNQYNNQENILPPRDVIYNLAIDHLEISDINNLAQSCKLVYYWLLSDPNTLWKRIARRDGFDGFNEKFSGEECKEMYRKLSNYRRIFEKELNCLESKYFSYQNTPSASYGNFMNFLAAINHDFGQLLYIFRNNRRNVLTRAYIATYGLTGHSEETSSYYEKIEKLAKLAMQIEDGTIFQTNLQYFGLRNSIIVACMFEDNYLKSNIELQNYFVINTAFRTGYPLESSKMLVESAINLLEKRFLENDYSTAQFFAVFCKVLKNSELRKLINSERSMKLFLQLFLRYNREEMNDIIIELLLCTEKCGKDSINTITYSVLIETRYVHPLLFNGLLKEKFFSDKLHPYYLSAVGVYISTVDLQIDCEIRERALSHLIYIYENKDIKHVRDPSVYHNIWSELKNHNSLQEFKGLALSKLEFFILDSIRNDPIIYHLGIIIEMANEDLSKTTNSLLDIRNFPSIPHTFIRIWTELFRIFERYSKSIHSPTESETFYSRLIQLLQACCEQPFYTQNKTMLALIENTLKWIPSQYANAIETLQRRVESLTFIITMNNH